MVNERVIQKFLEPTEFLRENLDVFIDVFVEYYGEEFREEIEEKFHNIHIVAYQTNKDLLRKLKKLEEKYGVEYIQSHYKFYYEQLRQNESIKLELKNKYEKEYIREIIPYLPPQMREKAKEFAESKDSLFVFSLINNFTNGYTLLQGYQDISIYEYFSEEMDEKLKKLEEKGFESNIIRKMRIEYLKAIGFDRGDDYKNYEGLEKYYPSKETVKKILQKKKELEDKYQLELVTKTYPERIYYEESQQLGLLCDNRENYALARVQKDHNCVTLNVKEKNGEITLYPEVLVYIGDNDAFRDEVVIHELNHVFEMVIESIIGNKITIRSGYDRGVCVIGEKDDRVNTDYNPRDFERTSETINELIAMEIYKKLKEKGISIMGNKNNKSKMESGYSDHFYIVEDFFKTYKKVILESRRTGNLEDLFDTVGEENFYALNDLVKEDYNTFKGEIRQQLDDDLKNNRDTKLTRKREKIRKKAELILQKMEVHNQTRKRQEIKHRVTYY